RDRACGRDRRRRVALDALRVPADARRARKPAPGRVRGRARRRRDARRRAPLRHAAADAADHHRDAGVPRPRRRQGVRRDLSPHRRWAGHRHRGRELHDLPAILHRRPDRLRVGDVGGGAVRAGAALHRRARRDAAANGARMKRARAEAVALHTGLAAAALIVLFPFAWIALAAFKTQISLLSGEVAFTPTAANFDELLFSSTSDYIANFANSFVIAGCSTLIVLATATLAAYSIERMAWPRMAVHAFLLGAAVF